MVGGVVDGRMDNLLSWVQTAWEQQAGSRAFFAAQRQHAEKRGFVPDLRRIGAKSI
ncbi:hypothetical protein GCM10011498_05100 [Amylibacter cionae]|uniref:Uncharacterized protein n=1 Tax=Neptunicoccus cionae TaxID=2035344 RepID=A0A916QRG5_9RHOB|nr:hypothetical protein GCM10011498_05100 [Amylibacter cionae]